MVRRIGTSGVDSISKFFKEGDNKRVAKQFAALVEDNIFVFNVGRVFGEPVVEPVDRGTLGDTGGASKEGSGVVSNE